jgi:Tol biopolymer transport system component
MSNQPDRWPQIREIFEATVALPMDARAAYLSRTCGGDEALRREVDALVASHDRATNFLETPASPGLIDPAPPHLEGRRIGPYQLASRIGAGGMGEVYRAHDVKLARDVAIKVLPPLFTADAERLARFEREARVLAALNHPHIGAIYGLEESAGVTALVLELVEGQTLSERIAAAPVPIAEALPIARQIAEALESAHERGIIHRDLKPANVKLTPEGTAKVLDFGLATIEPGADTRVESPPDATRTGVIAGTAPYMSPEQARGKRVDKRADIWAFGCVLYELLTGARAFSGETTTDVLVAVVDREPDFTALPPATPVSIRRLLARCLVKDPNRRLRDIGEARIAIDDAFTRGREAVPRRRAGWVPWLVAGSTLAVAAIAYVVGQRATGPAAIADVRVHRLTDWVGLEETPSMSPDGRSVAFVAGAGNSRHIWVRLIAGGAPLQLTRDPGEHLFPRWSPDSSSVVYFTPAVEPTEPGTLFEVSALGGTPRRIASAMGGADISHDGTKLTFFRFEAGRIELVIARRDGTDVRPLAQVDRGYYYLSPRWSPDDSAVAYHRTATLIGNLFVVPAAGGTPRQLTQDGTVQDGLSWSPDGSRLIFSATRGATVHYLPTTNLWSIGADGRDLRQLTFGEASYANPDVGHTGSMVANRWQGQSDIWRIPADGAPTENVARASRVTRQTSQVFTPSVSPDGSQVAYLSDAGNHANIWAVTLATGESRQVSYEQDPDVQVALPLWSPTGDGIAYFTARKNSVNGWIVEPDGTNRRLLLPDAAWPVWSSDGQWLYFEQRRLLKKLAASDGKIVTVRDQPATRPALSPDGRTLYYINITEDGSNYEVRAANPESDAGRLLARIPGRRMPRLYLWQPVLSPDGQWLLLALVDAPTTNLFGLSTTTGELRQLTDFQGRPTIIVRRASWAPDGRSVFAAIGERDADIVVIEGLRP